MLAFADGVLGWKSLGRTSCRKQKRRAWYHCHIGADVLQAKKINTAKMHFIRASSPLSIHSCQKSLDCGIAIKQKLVSPPALLDSPSIEMKDFY